jgi:hypothetical protein
MSRVKDFNDEYKHLPTNDLEYEKNENKDYDYDNDNKNHDDDDYDGDDDYDDYDDYVEDYNFTDYVDLLSVSEYVDNPDLDKITNIVFALFKTFDVLNCRETSFTIDFAFGDYIEWVKTAKLFNENIEYCNVYRILIDEETIICNLIKYDDTDE